MHDVNPKFTDAEKAAWGEGRAFYRRWDSTSRRRLTVEVIRQGRVTHVGVEGFGDEDELVRVVAPGLYLAYQYAFALVAVIFCSRFDAPAPGLVDEQSEPVLHPCTPFDEVYKRSMAGHNYGAHAPPPGGKDWANGKDWVMPYISLHDPLDDEERHRIEMESFERGRRSVLGESDGDDE